jgi:hypothetical protein
MLPYDQIPPERRTIGDATGRLDDHLGVLGVALAQWMARDDSRAEPEVRRAASTAMDAIDAMLAELHQLRARLVTEIRANDDAAAARADALLAGIRGSQARHDPDDVPGSAGPGNSKAGCWNTRPVPEEEPDEHPHPH